MSAVHSRPSSPTEVPQAKKRRIAKAWNPREEQWWIDFHVRWWGCGKENVGRAGTFIKIPQEELWFLLTIGLRRSRGEIYVRNEWELMYKRMCSAASVHEHMRIPGAIITGQPGIGKSFFAVYVLLRRMAEKQSVLYSDGYGRTYHIDEDGVHMARTNDIHLDDHFGHLPSAWSLVNASDEQPIPFSVTRLLPLYFVFGSPPFRRFKGLLNHYAHEWIMAPWSAEELHCLFQSSGFTRFKKKKVRTIEAAQRLHAQVGPCPRDIIHYLEDPVAYRRRIQEAVAALQEPGLIRCLLGFSFSIVAEAYCHLLVMDRTKPLDQDQRFLLSDLTQTCVKGDIVLDMLMDTLIRFSAADVRELLRSCSLNGSTFRGHAFKQCAIRCMTFKDENPSFDLCAPMLRESHDLATEYPVRFVYQPPNVQSQLQKLPCLRSRQITRWRDSDSGPLSDTVFFIPTVSSDALFDAFFVDINATGDTVLWIVKIAVTPAHKDSAQGFQLVEKLTEKVKKGRLRRVEVKYLLVVPCEGIEKSEVRWDMAPERFSAVAPGKVFVQFLRIPEVELRK